MENFDKNLREFVEENKDKINSMGECPFCKGLVGYNCFNRIFECIDCGAEFENLDEMRNWKLDKE